VLGLVPAGDRRHREGAEYAKVVGLPYVSFDVACVTDRNAFFQLEIFQFLDPAPRVRPSDWRPCDIGYSTLGVFATDFDEILDRAWAAGSVSRSSESEDPGSRCAWLRGPDGVPIALTDYDVYPQVGRLERPASSAVRSVAVSVPSLKSARRFWADTLGFRVIRPIERAPARSEPPGTPQGASKDVLLLDAGSVVLEIVQYNHPQGRGRPVNHRISDEGILNVAVGTTNRRQFDLAYTRLANAGYSTKSAPWALPGVATVVYFEDDQGFSLELLHVQETALERMGFRRSPSRRMSAST